MDLDDSMEWWVFRQEHTGPGMGQMWGLRGEGSGMTAYVLICRKNRLAVT